MQRYYPGFCAALFLVLLRTAIGWHFLYEGIEKIYSTPEGRDSVLARVLPRPSKPDPPFSAEGYLRASTGPLAPFFRSLVPDVDSLDKLNPGVVKATWERDLDRYAAHFQFDEARRTQARAALDARIAEADAWFRDAETLDKIQKYKDDLTRIDQVLSDSRSLSFERERAYEDRGKLEASRRELVGTVDGWSSALRTAWTQLASHDSIVKVAPPPALRGTLDWINILTMGGMVAVGLCLMLGFLTRPAALGATGYLALFYLSMPPWPHIPPGPMVEGHYLYVNKNLIELMACLLIASTPSGLWIGLDALLFGRGRRRREQARMQASAEPQSARAGAGEQPPKHSNR